MSTLALLTAAMGASSLASSASSTPASLPSASDWNISTHFREISPREAMLRRRKLRALIRTRAHHGMSAGSSASSM